MIKIDLFCRLLNGGRLYLIIRFLLDKLKVISRTISQACIYSVYIQSTGLQCGNTVYSFCKYSFSRTCLYICIWIMFCDSLAATFQSINLKKREQFVGILCSGAPLYVAQHLKLLTLQTRTLIIC